MLFAPESLKSVSKEHQLKDGVFCHANMKVKLKRHTNAKFTQSGKDKWKWHRSEHENFHFLCHVVIGVHTG